jgi:hypothetical protein
VLEVGIAFVEEGLGEEKEALRHVVGGVRHLVHRNEDGQR